MLRLFLEWALTGYLDLKWNRASAGNCQTEYQALRAREHEFAGYQRDMEAAIVTILFTQKEYRDFRTGQRSRAQVRAGVT
jgi:hypothetical protein